MKRMLCLMILSLAVTVTAGDKRYDFRASEAYAQLSTVDKQRLEQVRRDQALLWGALDMYCDDHDGTPPGSLDALVPRYLAELPLDPFATEQTASEQLTHGYTSSRRGFGYRFRQGAPGNRAWIISSVGLPKFPYLGERNSGLYICKGTWIS